MRFGSTRELKTGLSGRMKQSGDSGQDVLSRITASQNFSTGTETYPDGTVIKVEFYGKQL